MDTITHKMSTEPNFNIFNLFSENSRSVRAEQDLINLGNDPWVYILPKCSGNYVR